MKKLMLMVLLMTFGSFVSMADESYDDIYYNPKEKKAEPVEVVNTEKLEGVINGRDVDEYNRFGGYYQTDVDTIGAQIASGEDFVYTKEIQKYYNPTIVVDNADVFEEVLANSYGNVDIIVNAGVPSIATWYTPIYSPYYSAVYWGYSPYNYWNSLMWGPSYYYSSIWYDPWYNPWYNPWYDPWHWGPGWYPPYYPPYPHGPGWHPGHPGGGADNHWRPDGNRRNRPEAGWAGNTRPGGGTHRVDGGANRGGNGVTVNPNAGGNRRGIGYKVNGNGFRDNGKGSATNVHRNNNTTVKKDNTNKNNNNKQQFNNNNNNSQRRSGNTYNNNNNSNHRSGGSFNQGGNGMNRGGGTNRGGANRGGGSRGGGRHR